jgi:hypothetical protein
MPGNAVTRPVGPRPSRQPLRLPRHCERSEAIQTSTRGIDGLLRRFAPRNDVDMTSRSRGALRPRLASSFVPLRNRGRREDRVLAAPAVSRAICANKTAHEHTGQREHSGLPCAMALRLTSCSSRRTALLPPSPALLIASLTPAPRRPNHTTSPYASGAYVYRAIRVHRISPRVRDDGQRPSSAVRRAELCG